MMIYCAFIRQGQIQHPISCKGSNTGYIPERDDDVFCEYSFSCTQKYSVYCGTARCAFIMTLDTHTNVNVLFADIMDWRNCSNVFK